MSSDNLKRTGPPDTYFVALNQPWEVQHVAHKHGVSTEYVEAAALVLGTRTRKLIEELIEKYKPRPANALKGIIGQAQSMGIDAPVANGLRGILDAPRDIGSLSSYGLGDIGKK